ncbi:MAG: transcription antitermination factor NusB [Alphaproteobacteria bacterium]|nr:MAG: transcription antitermination factor NusB [Alphaproteobacteria bacterium]
MTDGSKKGFTQESRRAARLAAVQALYQMDMSDITTDEVIEEFVSHRLGQEIEGDQYVEADAGHFSQIVNGVVAEQASIDRRIEDTLASGWTMSRIDSILRAALRCAVYEMMSEPQIPAKVVINEYLNVVHAFFEGDEPKFLNGVLDKIARVLRASEFSS